MSRHSDRPDVLVLACLALAAAASASGSGQSGAATGPSPKAASSGVDALAFAAGEKCDANGPEPWSSDLTQLPRTPLLAVLKKEGAPWSRRAELSSKDKLVAAGDVGSIACISAANVENRSHRYSDGQPAYSAEWRIRVLDASDGRLLAAKTFASEPPRTKKGPGPGYGAAPVKEASAWLTALLSGKRSMADAVRSYSVWGTRGLRFSPDGTRLAGYGVSGAQVWEVSGGSAAEIRAEHAQSVAFSPEGATLAVGAKLGASLYRSADRVSLFTVPPGFVRVALSPDGRFLATAGGRELNIWGVEKHDRPKTLARLDSGACDVAFSPDGRTLAVAIGVDPCRQLDVRDVTDGKLLGSISGAVKIAPEAWLAVVVSESGTALVDLETRAEVAHLPVRARTATVDRRRSRIAATEGCDGKTSLWSFTGEKHSALTAREHAGCLDSLAFSADGRWLAAASDAGAWLWELEATTP